ncbi:MAG: hypothetical protein A3E36_02170 [Candidatus Andersenbacteria bacterium RIFCSPHIGHO2_12_FULL_45_11b]|uniref:Uncharacterized protein n=1 Tax=Candidatus Andersenbacteria bacterium RIFCSPHIGHO2_12_FULL_45_11b TaxID=1797282 RepID=A0A1G1XCW9_9BACT|nr:MAG: hypothetical protein A3E36_02170 [Candidatus Andersenbacteria bacterium RIFCSPHIGHO2_12_FULL_45_11b]
MVQKICYVEIVRKQKQFRFEVDQSIRIEETNKDSIVALANDEQSFTVKIPRRAKRQIFETFRRKGSPKQFAPSVFAVAIILIINKSKLKPQDLVIDIEYPGYETEIMQCISEAFPKLKIYFTEIGKKSPAHYAAYGVYIKKRKANALCSSEEILRQIKKYKK